MTLKAARTPTDKDTGSRLATVSILVVTLAGLALAARWVGPAPPRHLVLATGGMDGAYHAFGARYASALARDGIEVELRATAGAVENLALLETGEVDLAFMQGGVVHAEETEGLKTLGSLFREPVWVLHRSALPMTRLSDLAGLTLDAGAEGSGTAQLARLLLEANGVTEENARFQHVEPEDLFEALRTGTLDAALVVSSPDAPFLRRILTAGRDFASVLDVDRAQAYTRLWRFLDGATLPRGVLDLEHDIPVRPRRLLTAAASLVARDDLHPAVVSLFLEAARDIHDGNILDAPDEFPTPRHATLPLAPAAERWYASGPSFLFRVLPFWVAAMIERFVILLLPLLTLLLPLVKVAPPMLRWRSRSKIYRWYRDLRAIEQQVAGSGGDAELHARLTADLDRIEDEVKDVTVPLSYMEELYNLRVHLELVRDDLTQQLA